MHGTGVVIVGLLLLLIIPIPAFSIHETKNVTWQLVVISNESACGVNHYQMGQKYNEITKKYFELYGFKNVNYKPECYSKETFDWKYDKPSELDLLIIAYDRDLGREKLHSLDIGGFYSHSGGDITHNHTIIFCDCSNFRYSDPDWILSHELSHFILNYLGFDLNIVEDEIHSLDNKYDYCVERSYDSSCKEIVEHIANSNLGYKAKVMKPYQLAVGEELVFENPNELYLVPSEIQLLKEITSWWTEGIISDQQYSKGVAIITGLAIDDLSSGTFFAESATMILGEPSKDEKSEMENPEINSQSLQENFPFIEEWNPNPVYSGEYPQWFKTRAILWESNQIDNKEFVGSLEALIKSATEVQSVPLTIEDLLDKGNSYLEEGKYRKGLEIFDLTLAKSQEKGWISTSALIGKGNALYLLGDYHSALVYFDAVLEIEPDNSEALKKKGHTFAQLGNFERAKIFFELAVINQEFSR